MMLGRFLHHLTGIEDGAVAGDLCERSLTRLCRVGSAEGTSGGVFCGGRLTRRHRIGNAGILDGNGLRGKVTAAGRK
ncbi:hypothetical protein [Bacteroides pyogenes]|uniref:hypothetical protein n=1 Tax=Bacteroides pyogenes TaxID=310300 RepID=UPI003735C9CB